MSQVSHLPPLELNSLLLSYNSALLNANTLQLNYSKNFKAYYNQRREVDSIMLLILSLLVILRFLLENVWGYDGCVCKWAESYEISGLEAIIEHEHEIFSGICCRAL